MALTSHIARPILRGGGGSAYVGRVVLVLLVALALQQQVPVRAIGCVDIVADCGAKADNSTEDSAAFAVCQTLASKHSGCITVPAGHYRVAGIQLNISNIEIRIDGGAVFLPWRDGNHSVGTIFSVGTPSPVSADYVQNVSILGQAARMFTIDLSTALYEPWRARGVMYSGGIKHFYLANMLCKMSDPQRNPNTKYRSENPCIGFNWKSFNGERLNPQDGILLNLSCVGCTFGYGLIQMHSVERILAQNLYSEGGVTFRMETGGSSGGYVDDITARNITCKDGQRAVMAGPHTQDNGVFRIENVLSLGCYQAVGYGPGFSQKGLPPGHFSNASTIAGVVAVYGTHGQNSTTDNNVPSCAPCLIGGSHPPSYHVTVTGIKAIGFPPPSNRTECVSHTTSPKGCPFDNV